MKEFTKHNSKNIGIMMQNVTLLMFMSLTSSLLFGHEILLVFHLFILFRINSITYD